MDSSIPLASDKPADYGTTKAPAQQSMSAPLAVSDKDGFKLYDHNSVKLAGAPWETLTCSQRFVRAVKALFCGLCCIACSPIECCCGALIWLKISIWGNKMQSGSLHMLCCDILRGSPGKHLQVNEIDALNSDVIIPKDFVTNKQLKLHAPFSLRRSIQATMDFETEFGKFADQIIKDDNDKPRYYLNGGLYPADPSLEYTIWAAPAKKTGSWAAVTTVNDHVDTSCCCLRQHSTEIPANGVLGYITLLLASNEEFFKNEIDYHLTKAKHGENGTTNAVISDPAEQKLAEKKILFRHDHPFAHCFGNNSDEIDAYIFPKATGDACGLKVVHRYRVVVPSIVEP